MPKQIVELRKAGKQPVRIVPAVLGSTFSFSALPRLLEEQRTAACFQIPWLTFFILSTAKDPLGLRIRLARIVQLDSSIRSE